MRGADGATDRWRGKQRRNSLRASTRCAYSEFARSVSFYVAMGMDVFFMSSPPRQKDFRVRPRDHLIPTLDDFLGRARVFLVYAFDAAAVDRPIHRYHDVCVTRKWPTRRVTTTSPPGTPFTIHGPRVLGARHTERRAAGNQSALSVTARIIANVRTAATGPRVLTRESRVCLCTYK